MRCGWMVGWRGGRMLSKCWRACEAMPVAPPMDGDETEIRPFVRPFLPTQSTHPPSSYFMLPP